MIARSCPELSFSNPNTRVLISGSGNVAQYAALKVIELGAKVLSLSDSKGAILPTSESGFTAADIAKIAELKLRGGALEELVQAEPSLYTYHAGKRPWTLVEQCDIALPCATQNEVSGEEAEALVKAGVKIVAEGSNMVSSLHCFRDQSIHRSCFFFRALLSRLLMSSRSLASREASGMPQAVRPFQSNIPKLL